MVLATIQKHSCLSSDGVFSTASLAYPFTGPLWNLQKALLILLLMMEGDTRGYGVNDSIHKNLRAGCGSHACIHLSPGKLRKEDNLNFEAIQGYLLSSRPAWTPNKKNLGKACEVVDRH